MTSTLREIRKIDNSRLLMPIATTFLVIILVVIGIWFFRGGSFRLYASAFFSLYYLTGQVWVSVLLIGVGQNIILLPMRFIGMRLSQSFKDFEEGIEESSNEDAYLVFTEKVRKGDMGIVFYILNFVINAIAFLSAGRIFLIDFYTQNLSPALLYKWVPYPDYPLKGTIFRLPFFKNYRNTQCGVENDFVYMARNFLIFCHLEATLANFSRTIDSQQKIIRSKNKLQSLTSTKWRF